MVALIVIVVVVLFALIVGAARTIRVIPQARAGVVERLGAIAARSNPGLTIVTPFIDRVKPLVDLREQVVNSARFGHTEDNVVVAIERFCPSRSPTPARPHTKWPTRCRRSSSSP